MTKETITWYADKATNTFELPNYLDKNYGQYNYLIIVGESDD